MRAAARQLQQGEAPRLLARLGRRFKYDGDPSSGGPPRGGPKKNFRNRSPSAAQNQQQDKPVVSSRWKFQQAAAKLEAMAAAAKDEAAKAADVTTISIPRPAYVKTKALSKTAGFIMNILNKEAVLEAKKQRSIPVLKPGYVVQLKIEVPENKRRVQEYRGLILGIRKSGIHTTFRIRRNVGGNYVENVIPLYSPLIKEWKVLERKRVHRAKLYYLRDGKFKLKTIPVRRRRGGTAAGGGPTGKGQVEGAKEEEAAEQEQVPLAQEM